MPHPTVSIVIPCYRHAQYLPTAVESALNQTGVEVEVIVVNDGSDDATHDIALGYGSQISYRFQQNQGLPAARNTGLALATADYVLFLDSDDALLPEAAQQLLSAVGNRPGAIAVMGHRYFRERLDEANAAVFPPSLADPVRRFLDGNAAPVHCFLGPRRAIQSVGGFDVRLRALEDWDLWLRLALQGLRFVNVPFAGALYRKYAGSMSTDMQRMHNAHATVLLKALAALENWNAIDSSVDLGPSLRYLSNCCLVSGCTSEHCSEIGAAVQRFAKNRPGLRGPLDCASPEQLRGCPALRSRRGPGWETLRGYHFAEAARHRLVGLSGPADDCEPSELLGISYWLREFGFYHDAELALRLHAQRVGWSLRTRYLQVRLKLESRLPALDARTRRDAAAC